MQSLRDEWRKIKDERFFSIYSSKSAVFCLQRFSNKRGIFIELSKWNSGGKCSNIVIPARNNGSGWAETVQMLGRIINRDFNDKTTEGDMRNMIREGESQRGSLMNGAQRSSSHVDQDECQETGINRVR